MTENATLDDHAEQGGELAKIKNELVKIVESTTLAPKEKVDNVIELFHSEYSEYFSGPLPSPRMMKEYERILPGMPNRIVTMAEEQQRHRISLERKTIQKQIGQSGVGQIFAFVLGLALISFSVYCIYKGFDYVAGIVMSLTIISVIGLFITGKYFIKKDLKEKQSR